MSDREDKASALHDEIQAFSVEIEDWIRKNVPNLGEESLDSLQEGLTMQCELPDEDGSGIAAYAFMIWMIRKSISR